MKIFLRAFPVKIKTQGLGKVSYMETNQFIHFDADKPDPNLHLLI